MISMKKNYFKMTLFFINCFIFYSPIFGQEQDSLTLPYEVRLNIRQPPDTVLKTIDIKTGMIIGEMGLDEGAILSNFYRIGPSGMLMLMI